MEDKENHLKTPETGSVTDVSHPTISEKELDLALKVAKEKLIERKKKEYELWLISKY